MVGTVTDRAMPMPVHRLVVWQQAFERSQQVGVGARADLDDDHAGRRMRDEDREEPVAFVGDERRTGGRQVREPDLGPGADREVLGLYGKMLRRASRNRPTPPPPGANS